MKEEKIILKDTIPSECLLPSTVNSKVSSVLGTQKSIYQNVLNKKVSIEELYKKATEMNSHCVVFSRKSNSVYRSKRFMCYKLMVYLVLFMLGVIAVVTFIVLWEKGKIF